VKLNGQEMDLPNVRIFSAIRASNGCILRLWLEAINETDAREFCVRIGAGLEGESLAPESKQEPLAEAYDAKTARRLLGGISRSSLYKELILGNLERVTGTRRVLITRESLERRCRHR
jgi:hypothetical protein